MADEKSIAEKLGSLQREGTKIVLVTHSQGGLIVQRYLARRLASGHGEELRRIRRIVMYACPNNGSQALLAAGADRVFGRMEDFHRAGACDGVRG